MSSAPPGRSLPAYFFYSTAATAMVLLLIVAAIWMAERSSRFEQESAALAADLIRAKEEELRQQVSQAVEYIEYAASRTEDRLRRRIREQVEAALTVLVGLHERNGRILARPELETLLRETLRPMRFGRRGYFFITRSDGLEILFADRPEMEGRNLLEMRDARGKAVIKEMIALTADNGEGFVEYDWTRPGSDANTHRKLAFVKRFAPFDWIVGTGEYLEDMEEEIQQEALGWLSHIRFGQDGYLFGSTFDGDQLFTNGRVTKGGPNIFHLTDPGGARIFQAQLEAARRPEGGFVRYSWPRLDGGPPSPKIAYVRAVPRWSWILGSGLYTDDVDAAVATLRKKLHQELRMDMTQDSLIFLVVFLALALSTTVFSRRVKRELDAFAAAVSQASVKDTALDVSGLRFPETRDIAASVNELTRHRMVAQAALRRSESLLRAMVANLPFDFWARDAEQRVILQSAMSIAIWGDLRGTLPEDAGAGPETVALWRANNARALAGENLQEETKLRLPDGRTIDCLNVFAPVRDGAETQGILGINLDLSPVKQAELALRASELMFRTLAEQSPVSIMGLDTDGRITFVNDWHLKVFCLGRVNREFFIGKKLSELPGLSSVPGLPQRLLEVLDGRTIFLEDVFIPRFTGGHSGWVTIRGVPIMRGDTVTGGILIREDITERKRMVEAIRDSERRLFQVIQFLPDATVAVNREGRVTAWNRAMEALTGVAAHEVIGRGDREYGRVFWGERRPMLIDHVLGGVETASDLYDILSADDDSLTATMRRETAERGEQWYLMRASAIRDNDGALTGAIESVRDITASKLSENELKASLQEKEVLLREIHHRVKNNLQVISSMLRLQAGELGGDHVPPLLESLARIRSMSLVHEKLYLSEHLGAIDMKDYVTSQLSALFGIYGSAARNVQGEVEGEGLLLPVDHAIPCGLIINELVTNSLKHAFKGRAGSILVRLGREGGDAIVSVRDDGVGLAEGFDPMKAQSVGLQIVQNLALQLKGTLTQMKDKPGFGFELRFPMPGG